MMKPNCIFLCLFYCFLMVFLRCEKLTAQQFPNLQSRIFKETNQMRRNPALYYQKHKNYFDKEKGAAVFFRLVGPTTDFIWSDSLYNEAKNAVITKFKSDGKFLKTFCQSSGFGANHPFEDSVVIKFISENYTTLLSTDYNAIGIYSECRNQGKFSEVYVSFAYTAAQCNFKAPKYRYPAEPFEIDREEIDLTLLNTGGNENYMNTDEKEMLKEINFARCYPKIYAKIIANYLIKKGKNLTFNDYIAGQEIVEELNNMKKLKILLPDERLYHSAKKHGEDMVKRGYSSHTGSDNSTPFDRIKKILGDVYIKGSENLVGGGSPSENVMQLLIDGGIGSRGHRYNIINPEWTHVGCYCAGKIGTVPYFYIQNFAIIK